MMCRSHLLRYFCKEKFWFNYASVDATVNYCEMFIVFSSVTARTERLCLPIWASDLNGKTLSLHRKKICSVSRCADHTYFWKENTFFLIACNPELIVRWLTSFIDFRSVTARTVKSVNIMCKWLQARNHKKRELNCVSNAYRMRMSNQWDTPKKTIIMSSIGKHRVEIGSRSEFYCFTHSLTH